MTVERFRMVALRHARGSHFVAMLCMGPIAGVAIAGLSAMGLVAPSPIWLIPLVLIAGQMVSTITDLVWRTWRTRLTLHVKVAAQAIAVTAVIYATGWGPGLSVGLLLVGQESLATAGSSAHRVVLGWNLGCLAVGQSALAAGWVPSLLPRPQVHGLAMLMAIGIAFSYRSLAGALADKERAGALTASAERRFRALVHSSHDLVFVVAGAGTVASVTYASPSCRDVLGYDPGELLGDDSSRLVHPGDIDELRLAIGRCLTTAGANSEFSMRIRRSDDQWRWLEGNARNLLDDPAVQGMVVTARDVTERRMWNDQQAAIAALDRFALQASSIEALTQAAALSIELTLDVERCRIRSCSADLAEVDSGTGPTLLPFEWDVDPEWSLYRVPIGDADRPFGEIDVASPHPLTSTEKPFVEAIASILLLAMVRSQAENAMRHQATHDPLTRLPNRTLFNDRLEQALHRRDRFGGGVAVLVADLDGFKNVNDSLGHQAGDALLNAVADRFRSALRGVDTIARLGGDEFAVLVNDLDGPAEARVVAQRILDSLVVPLHLGDRDVAIGASVGIAIAGESDTTFDGLLGAADAAMYRAKREGKGCYREFESSMHAAAVERMDLEQALRLALSQDGFGVHYQPIIHAASGGLVAFEALARWTHPGRGPIRPDVFIPLAEEVGLIVEIGRRILEEACCQARLWQDGFPLLRPAVSVNVSVRQLVDPAFVGDVVAALQGSGLDASALTIEVTESVLASDSGRVVGVLDELRASGVRIAIDDFGTGYSSFATLSELPVDILKIDKRFVDNLLRDVEGRGILSAIMQLAQTLGLGTIAEGVEHDEQRRMLEELGCTHLQGYLLAMPMPGRDTIAYLRNSVAPPGVADPASMSVQAPA